MGALFAISALTLVQFIDLNVAYFSGGAVSLQKVCALVCVPIAFVMIGRLAMHRLLYVIFICFFVANTAWYVFHGELFSAQIITINSALFFDFAGAVVLYMALTERPGNVAIFARLMVLCASASACLDILQALHLMPMYMVPAGELHARVILAVHGIRASGLKYDPNFEALVLAAGGACTSVIRRRSVRNGAIGLIALGILCTSSRTGVIALGLALLLGVRSGSSWDSSGVRVALHRIVVLLTVVAVAGTMYMSFVSQPVQRYITERVGTTYTAAGCVLIGSCDVERSSSAHSRAELAMGSVKIFWSHPLVGTGAGNAVSVLQKATGFANVSHNTYLQMAMSDGVLGIVTVGLWAAFLFRNGVMYRQWLVEDALARDQVALGRRISIVFLVGAFLLSLNLIFLFWFPVAIVAACRRNARILTRHVRVTERADTDQVNARFLVN